jgi:hypothetical protein
MTVAEPIPRAWRLWQGLLLNLFSAHLLVVVLDCPMMFGWLIVCCAVLWFAS